MTSETPASPPPSTRMMGMLYGSLVTQLLVTCAELGIPDLVAQHPRHVDDLAERTASDPDTLYRFLRTLASQGVFTEVTPRTFGLTPLAGTLRSDQQGSMRDLARSFGRLERHLAFSELAYSIRSGRPSFDHVYGTDWWSHLAANPDHADIFNRHMGNVAREMHAAALEACDLSGTRHLVDVGGGNGYLIAEVLSRYPDVEATLFDAPHVIGGAEPVLEAAGVVHRVETIGGDFFTSVPTGGDCYVLSWVIHDWNDAEAQTLLTNVRRAMKPDGRVLIIDAVLPEGDAAHPGKLTDMVMLALLTGRERTEDEFASLLAASGLQHVETRSTSSPTSVLVAAPV